MKKKPIRSFQDAQQARDFAVEWQHWAGNQNLSLGELADWQAYFGELGAN